MLYINICLVFKKIEKNRRKIKKRYKEKIKENKK